MTYSYSLTQKLDTLLLIAEGLEGKTKTPEQGKVADLTKAFIRGKDSLFETGREGAEEPAAWVARRIDPKTAVDFEQSFLALKNLFSSVHDASPAQLEEAFTALKKSGKYGSKYKSLSDLTNALVMCKSRLNALLLLEAQKTKKIDVLSGLKITWKPIETYSAQADSSTVAKVEAVKKTRKRSAASAA